MTLKTQLLSSKDTSLSKRYNPSFQIDTTLRRHTTLYFFIISGLILNTQARLLLKWVSL